MFLLIIFYLLELFRVLLLLIQKLLESVKCNKSLDERLENVRFNYINLF